jgi:hypothetical protein
MVYTTTSPLHSSPTASLSPAPPRCRALLYEVLVATSTSELLYHDILNDIYTRIYDAYILLVATSTSELLSCELQSVASYAFRATDRNFGGCSVNHASGSDQIPRWLDGQASYESGYDPDEDLDLDTQSGKNTKFETSIV